MDDDNVAASRPNILFIMADQFRADAIGCIDHCGHTPNLDRVAAVGWQFRNAYANSAECVPSRLSLATGLYPHQTGIDRNIVCTLDPTYLSWMQMMQIAGYRTSVFGKTHLHHTQDLRDTSLMNEYGFQTVDETAGPRALAEVRSNLTDLWNDRGVWEVYQKDIADRFSAKPFLAKPTPLPLDLYYDRYVGRVAKEHLTKLESDDSPWFCWISFGGPHEPWDVPEPYASLFKPADMPPPRPRLMPNHGPRGLVDYLYESTEYCPPQMSHADIAAMRSSYAGNVTLIDDEIGGIIDVVRQRGELDRTLIIFTSDHGEMNGDYGLIYKANFLDPSIKIPLILVPPGKDAIPSQACDALVELIDVGATLLDYAGAPGPIGSLPRSLRPLIEGRTTTHRHIAISEFAGHTCAITDAFKIEFDQAMDAVLLIDRIRDPFESANLVLDQEYEGTIRQFRRQVDEFLLSTPTATATLLLP